MKPRIGMAACALAMSLASGIAKAQGEAPLRLSYRAPLTCRAGPAFAAIVHADAPSVWLELSDSTDDEAADIVVILGETEGSFVGSLQIRRGDGSAYFRQLEAKTCDELSTALGFVAALALTGQVEPSEASRLLPPVLSAPPLAAEPPPPPATPPPLAMLPPTALLLDTPRAPIARRQARWGWGGSVELGVRTGLAPTWANTEQASVEVRSLGGVVWAPRLRVGLIHAEPVTRKDPFGDTRFAWLAGRLSACPLQVRILEVVEGVPCAGLELGVIDAAGTPKTPSGVGHDSSSLWLGALGSVRLQVQLIGAIFLIGEAELVLPLTRPRFSFDPNTPVYAVPGAAGAAHAGLLAQFP